MLYIQNRIGLSKYQDISPTDKEGDKKSGATPQAPPKKATVAPAVPVVGVVGTFISKVAASTLGFFAAIPILFQGDSSPAYVKEASDSSKSEKHGDGGRTASKDEKQIKDLQEQLGNAKNNKEREAIKQKIRNIRQNGEKNNKGEEHSRSNKR